MLVNGALVPPCAAPAKLPENDAERGMGCEAPDGE
jgi:hypothetical protein